MRMKKWIIAGVAALTAAAMIGTTVYADRKYAAKDLRELSDYLLGVPDSKGAYDVNGDDRVDAFDMVAMRKQFFGTGDFMFVDVAVTEENVKYTGRNYYDSNDTAWLVMSGSAVEFTVYGRSATVAIKGDAAVNNDKDFRPRYAVEVDGEIILDEMLDVGEKNVELFYSDEPRTAHVKIIHLSEANNGAVGVRNIRVNTDVPVPVVPEPKKDLSIEFIGDSITCAYGVEGANQYESFKTSTENFMKSYAYLTAKKLDADYSAVSYSGYGIISGYSNDGAINMDSVLPDYYDFIGRPMEYRKEWDHSAHKYDAIVINLGTNDDTYVSKDFDTRSREYTDGYIYFLGKVHEAHPESYIICTLGTMGCTELYPCIENAVAAYKEKYSTDRIMCYQSATHTQSDGMGSDWHPSEKTQQNSAYVLADKICQALGIESDQIGIDIAADAEYSTATYDSAMMSDYFSDWDKSYHITVVNGGSSAESIQANVAGIGLKKGGEYKLQFLIDTADGNDIPFCVRNSATGEVYFEDVFKGTGSKSAYEKTFTSPATADCEIVYSIGGKDSSRVSLYELKMYKTG